MSPYLRSAKLMLACVFSCALSCSASFAQLAFNPHQAAPLPNRSGIGPHGDFNGDGREDILASVHNSSTGNYDEVLYLSTADGTYDAPRTMPAYVSAIGDFNHDGKLDFANTESTSISVYLGNGDGTFQAAKTFIGANATVQTLLAADLNHDNKTDLVELLQASSGLSSSLQLWISNGDGTFTKGQTISTSVGPVANQKAAYGLVGDFDGDGKPDVAVIYGYVDQNSETVAAPSTVQIWYGDGAGHLGTTPSYFADPNKNSDDQPFVADLNNDGKSDIVFTASGSTTPVIGAYFGSGNRTLSYKQISTGECASYFTAADFNGDGRNDIAYLSAPCNSGPASNVVVRLGTGSGNFGAAQIVYQNQYELETVYAVRTTLGTRPDIVFDQNNGGTTNDSFEILTNASTGSFPGCGLSGKAEGITICSPGASSSSPVKFSIGAAGPTPMRTVAVWADGKKLAEQKTHAFSNYSFLDSSVALAAGSHAVTVNGIGWDGTHQTKSFTLTISGSGSCTVPSSAGVNVCSPVNGSTVSSPVQINAAATVSGGVYRFELWSGSTKLLSVSNSGIMNQAISLAPGSYHLVFVARNISGTHEYATSDITVK
jgi:hypothetical protein